MKGHPRHRTLQAKELRREAAASEGMLGLCTWSELTGGTHQDTRRRVVSEASLKGRMSKNVSSRQRYWGSRYTKTLQYQEGTEPVAPEPPSIPRAQVRP